MESKGGKWGEKDRQDGGEMEEGTQGTRLSP